MAKVGFRIKFGAPIKGVLKNSFAKNVVMIAGGTACAQLLNALASPIISRMYSPAEYGVLTVYTAVLGMLTIIGALKYEWAIPIADEDKTANVLMLCILVLVSLVLITGAVILFWGDALFALFFDAVLVEYKLFIPVGILLTGLYNIFTQYALRENDYKTISKTKYSQSFLRNLTQIGLGSFGIGPLGLILGQILGQSGGTTTLVFPLVSRRHKLVNNISIRKIMWCAKRYGRFPLLSAPGQLLNTAGSLLPVFFIASLYDSKTVGFYGLAVSIISLPMTLIGLAIADVFYGEASRMGRNKPERLKQQFVKLFHKLLLIGLIPFLTVILFGPLVFSVVFGSEWYQAGVYARLMSIMVYARLVCTPLSRILVTFERQKENLYLDIVRVVLVLGVFALTSILQLDSYFTVGFYSLSMAIVYLATFVLAHRVINEEAMCKS